MVAGQSHAEPIDRPDFLRGSCSPERYLRWLGRKARAQVSRDRKRGNRGARVAEYRSAIHAAVLRCKGRDAYTGLPLRWDQLGNYDNAASRRGGREYKKRFEDVPTVDHVGDGRGKPRFEICAWRLNDAKSDLPLSEFLTLCRQVLAFSGRD